MNRATAAAIALITALSATAFVLQAVVVRPHLYPAGAGFITSGDAVMNELGEPAAVGVAHLPDLRTVLDRPVTVTEVWPGSPADRAGLAPGAVITAVESAGGIQLAIGPALPADPLETMAVWRTMYRLKPTGAITLTVVDPTSTRPRASTLPSTQPWNQRVARKPMMKTSTPKAMPISDMEMLPTRISVISPTTQLWMSRG